MKKEVTVTISGTQLSIDPDDTIEVVSKGIYYKKDDKIYVKYTEETEEDKLDCMLTIEGNDNVRIVKKGAYSSVLEFKNGASCAMPYSTPFGNMMMETVTESLAVYETGDGLVVKIRYVLNINGEHVSMCEVDVKVEGCL